jgi:hypothetical protein
MLIAIPFERKKIKSQTETQKEAKKVPFKMRYRLNLTPPLPL